MQEKEIRCPRCNSNALVKDGNYNGEQGYKCKECKKRFSSGKYVPIKKTPKKDIKFDLYNFVDKLKPNSIEERKIATITAKKIARKKREDIEEELLNNLFKGNQELDYGIIKILIFTKNWGIEALLNIIFNNNIELSRLHIATICKYLAENIEYSWKYVKEWLYYNDICENDVSKITPENFISTKSIYENYNAVITRFFYKLSKIAKKKLRTILCKSEIEKLLNKDFLVKFNEIKFDEFCEEYGLNIGKSIKVILEKLNDNEENYRYSDDLLKLGLKWEKFVDKIITERCNNVVIHKRLENNLIPDIAIIDEKGKCEKIIECKLNLNYENLYETIRKYGKYCNIIEMWGLSKSNFKYDKINMQLIYDAMKKYYYNGIEKEFNKNLKLKILCFDEIIQNVPDIGELNLLYNEYSNLGGNNCYLDVEEPLEVRIDYDYISYFDDYFDNEKKEVKIVYEPFSKETNMLLDIENSIYVNNAIKNSLKYKIKSSDFIEDYIINGVIKLKELRKFKIPIEYYEEEKRLEYKDISFLELSFDYINNCSYTIYEIVFDKLYLIDSKKNEYKCIRGHYMRYPLDNCHIHIKEFDDFNLPQNFETNVSKNTKIYFKIPDDFNSQELELKVEGSKSDEIKLIKFNNDINSFVKDNNKSEIKTSNTTVYNKSVENNYVKNKINNTTNKSIYFKIILVFIIVIIFVLYYYSQL